MKTGTAVAQKDGRRVAMLLVAYAKRKDLWRGTRLHADILRNGLLAKSCLVAGALISMYAKCGALTVAQQVLDELPVRDLVSWTALIGGYAQHGHGEDALKCLDRMESEGHSPNEVTFTCILKACGTIVALSKGIQIHNEIVRRGLLQKNVVLGNALVDMYVKCGSLVKARHVLDGLLFRNVITWSTLIAGYTKQGHGQEALKCFDQMLQDGHSPNAVTFTCILNACGDVGALEKGEQVHDEIVRKGLMKENVLLGNALMAMYVKCSALLKAKLVFDKLQVRDAITWTTLIAGYVQQGHGREALEFFDQMHRKGCYPNSVTLISVLKACASIGAIDKGEVIHNDITKEGWLGKDIAVGAALVDMYAKCGAFMKARKVLYELPFWNVVAWNALISGFSQRFRNKEVLHCFEEMQGEGVSPDASTFVCVLNACTHTGLLQKGQTYFDEMNTIYGITPNEKHICCMVDLYGRAGELEKAFAMIESVSSCDLAIWHAMLGACQKQKNAKLGRLAFERAIQIDENDTAAYACMANIYVAAGMPEDADKIEAMRLRNNTWDVG